MRQVFYYKMRQFYSKCDSFVQNPTILLQNATVSTKCDAFITNRGSNVNIRKDKKYARVWSEIVEF